MKTLQKLKLGEKVAILLPSYEGEIEYDASDSNCFDNGF
jgi:hypothetical protein